MGPKLHIFDISHPAANLKVLNGTVDISMATIMLISMHIGPRSPWLATSGLPSPKV